jgi:coenzyme F420-0:L-glutamate ligase/coenzyme F420-1:gamma-L-glutamate ligase
MNTLQIIPVPGIPEIKEGDDIARIVFNSAFSSGIEIKEDDVIIIKQKIVSKAEGRLVRIDSVKPSKRAIKIALKNRKDPRLVELILREARRVVRAEKGVIITETRHGFVCANSGVDRSNVPSGFACLLPEDPDRSARKIRMDIEKLTSKKVAVIISDTFGRPWRKGQVDVAIGCSGIEPIVSYRGMRDSYGYTLKVTEPAIVDEIASAAELASGKLSSIPVVILRGLKYKRSEKGVKKLIMEKERDLFR